MFCYAVQLWITDFAFNVIYVKRTRLDKNGALCTIRALKGHFNIQLYFATLSHNFCSKYILWKRNRLDEHVAKCVINIL